MFAVIFVVQPKAELTDKYLDLAKFLKPALEKIDGFIDNERFGSRRDAGRVLSLSTWRDEKAVIRWRTLAVHHKVQEQGRFEVFENYHLRVGEITADTHVPAGLTLRQERFDETEVGVAKVTTITEVSPAADGKAASHHLAAVRGLPRTGSVGLLDHEAFESIYNPGKLLLLASWRNANAADRWTPKPVPNTTLRHRAVRLIREYGMADRREAPQSYPPIPESSAQP
jgi:heme-degrading monooxygenase HmoA